MDEARFCLNPKLSAVWAPKASKPIVKTNYSSGSSGVFGAYDSFGNFSYQFASKQNSESFLEFLEYLLGRYSNILLILDNAAIHKSKKVQKFVSEHSSRLELFYLPPYSPELNATEECWRQVRLGLTNNRFFENMDELKASLAIFFEEHKFTHDLFSYLCR
jgi:transposase